MSESEVIKALRGKRSEIAGALRDLDVRAKRLKQVIAGIDETIRVFVPGSSRHKIPTARPYKRGVVFERNELPRAIIDMLREAHEPLRTSDITARIALAKGVEGKAFAARVWSCLTGLSKRGIIAPQGDETPKAWTVKR
jgi:hypothetical protein